MTKGRGICEDNFAIALGEYTFSKKGDAGGTIFTGIGKKDSFSLIFKKIPVPPVYGTKIVAREENS